MREILFRGKRIDNGEWIEGHYGEYMLMSGESIPCISIPNKEAVCGSTCCDVETSTVGQYTGLTDKNGKKIFEGDIVKHESGATVLFHKVVFERRNGCAYFGAVMGEYETWGFCNSFPPTLVEIVGNIHDNPELLEVTK